MHPDVAALIALQAEDDIVEGIVSQLEAIQPRLHALDAARARAVKAVNELSGAIDADERKRSELVSRLAEHKARHEHNVAQLDVVKRMREATAAVAQVEMGRKVLLDLEGSLRDVTNRLNEQKKGLLEREAELTSLDGDQVARRDAIKAEQGVLEATLVAARKEREVRAAVLGATLRSRYDRIRARRRSQSLYALESGACGACDTAIPVHRRQAMTNSGSIEVCEACGVLIYAAE